MITATFTNGEACDRCKQKDDRPGDRLIELYQRSRFDKNIVVIHESCLERMIALAKRKFGPHGVPS